MCFIHMRCDIKQEKMEDKKVSGVPVQRETTL